MKKSHTRKYRFIQDLRVINDVVQEIHAMLPSPYTLLAMVPKYYGWFSMLDFKDNFFCILLDEQAQSLFAFEW